MTTTRNVLDEVLAERERQDAKWGEQNHPMIPADIEREARAHNTVPAFFACHVLGIDDAKAARDECERAHRLGYGTYTHIIIEELAEFIEACVKHGEASDEAWGELVQTAAVGVAMLEALARRRGHRAEEPRQEHDALRAQLAQVTAERDALRAIVEGRTTPPTDAEIEVHDAAGGLWRCVAIDDPYMCRDAMRGRGAAYHRALIDALESEGARWWALDAQKRPCAWPVVDR
jgi:hypothetical protein